MRAELLGNGVASSDVEVLLTNVTGRSRAWLLANDDVEISDAMAATARTFVARRGTGEPVPYIVGSVGFYGHTLLVDANVLVPRPETEHLIDDALQHIRQNYEHPHVLDVGTGSGAIACVIAAEFSKAIVHGIDVSPEALLVALANAHRLGVEERVSLFFGDLTQPVHAKCCYDVIVANLPYVPTADISPAPDPVSFEPRLALDGGADGLDHYRRLLPLLHGLFSPGALLLLEAAPPNIRELARLAEAAFPYSTVQIGSDYAQLERYVKVTDPA